MSPDPHESGQLTSQRPRPERASWPSTLTARFPWLLAVLLLIGVPMGIFAKTAQEVWQEGGFDFDRTALLFIHSFATPTLDRAMVFVTTLAGAPVLPAVALVVVGLLWWRRQRRAAVFVLLALAGAAALMLSVKALFHRVRPQLWVSPAPETDFGFPSGHAIASVSLLFALVLLAWPTRWRWPSLALGSVAALLVGFSRLYLGVHYPSDVLAAWAAGVAWTYGLYRVLFWRRGRLS